jgi:hypothetical protein
MGTMAIGTGCMDVSMGAQAFVEPQAIAPRAHEGVGALSTDTGWDPEPAAVAGASGAGVDRMDSLLDAARAQMTADGAGRNPLAHIRLMVAGDDSDFGRQQQALVHKLARFSGTLDAHEVAAVEELLGRGQQAGGFSPAELARVMVQVEGSASGLPPQYLAAADAAQQVAVQLERDLEELVTRLNEVLGGPDGSGREGMHLLDQVQQYADGMQLLQERLRANFELALEDPSLAIERLQSGMETSGFAAA